MDLTDVANANWPQWAKNLIFVGIVLGACVTIYTAGKVLGLWRLLEMIAHELSANGGRMTVKDQVNNAVKQNELIIEMLGRVSSESRSAAEDARLAVRHAERAVEKSESAEGTMKQLAEGLAAIQANFEQLACIRGECSKCAKEPRVQT